MLKLSTDGNRAQRRPVAHLTGNLLERGADVLLLRGLWRVVSDRGPVLDLGLGLELALRTPHSQRQPIAPGLHARGWHAQWHTDYKVP